MKRDFSGTEISQTSSDKYFNATELLSAYNSNSKKKKVIAEFWSNKGTKDFMTALCNDLNIGNNLYLPEDLYTATRGVSGGTYLHPYLFVKFAMWLSPEFEVQVIKWVYDNLIDFRIDAGDHYNEMCKAIKDKYEEFYSEKPDPLIFIKEANFLNMLVFGTLKGRKRNEATESELAKINALQLANIKLIKMGIGAQTRKQRLKDLAELI